MYNEKTKQATLTYLREKTKLINVRYKKDYYADHIQPALKKSGMPAATFIKQAIEEKIERDHLL